MTKYLLLSLLLALSLFSQYSAYAEDENSFEKELQMLEKQDEEAFNRAEAVTAKELNEEVEILTDTVSTANAAVEKKEAAQIDLNRSDKKNSFKTRRVRSR